MKNILVTGRCGFVRINRCLSINKLDFKIFSLDNLACKTSYYNLKLLKKESDINNFIKY